MHDAVAGMHCARRYGAITQGWFGGVADRMEDDKLPARLRISSRPLVASRLVSPAGAP